MAQRTRPGEPAKWLDRHLDAPPTNDCVEWPYACDDLGYAQMRARGKTRRVSHIVLERTGRPRPPAPDGNALHSCHHPPCINPAHLRWGKHADNMEDRDESGRTLKGEDNGWSVLTEAEVVEIRSRYAAGGVFQRELADEYGVERSTIGLIVNRRRWCHI